MIPEKGGHMVTQIQSDSMTQIQSDTVTQIQSDSVTQIQSDSVNCRVIQQYRQIITWNEDSCHVEKLVSSEVQFHLETAVFVFVFVIFICHF